MKQRLLLFVLTLLTCVSSLLAQTKISGTVFSAADNEPLVSARIQIVGTKEFTATDIHGRFSMTTKVANPKISVSFVGMDTQVLPAGENMKILLKDTQVLTEVVVTGLAKTDRRLFTGATNKVDAGKARLSGVADVSRSLEGQAAGVSVQNVSGTFGSAPKIRVRGATSIYGSSKPLWVVDGVRLQRRS